jgi:hypothetical protein
MRPGRWFVLLLFASSSVAVSFGGENRSEETTIDPLASRRPWVAEGNQDLASFGASVASAGDVNGDGYADVIVGAPSFDDDEVPLEGAAFVYQGSAAGLNRTPAWVVQGDRFGVFGVNLGAAVGTAGDVNRDGYSDVIVGAYGYSEIGQSLEGLALVYHGSSSGLSSTPAWKAEGDEEWAFFGISVGTAGDVNGDGYSDVIVGASGLDDGQGNEGAAFVYHGSADGLKARPDWKAESDQVSAYFGGSVGTAGDVNGDGYSDVIVGAEWFDNGQSNEGAAFVYQGSAHGLSATPDWTAESDQADSDFGISVGTAGDVNGDGHADVIVGAPSYATDQDGEGRALVFHGSGAGLSEAPDWIVDGNRPFAGLGISAATAGDVNGDGYADAIVGASYFNHDLVDEGRAFVYYGSAGGLSTTPSRAAQSDQEGALFGTAVGTAGDVSGDGYDDVIVGAPEYDHGQTDEGAAFVFRGRPA